MLKPCLRAWLLLLLLLSGCISVPFDYPKSPSAALSASADTDMGEYALEWTQKHGTNSGFLALAGGNEALGARLKLIESAEVSIDAQYFLLKPDEAGGLFIGNLLNAADRGVRVRLLIDDIFTPGLDSQFTLFNSHPNVEVRLFNPLSRQSAKSWSMLWNFSRANRRMHNKSFTVDDSITIIGGRNIADEYFEIKPEVEFNDFELLAVGPVVPEVNAAFDLFWNSELAVPMEAFDIDYDPQQLDHWREVMTDVVSGARESVYARAVDSELLQDLVEGRVEPLAAPAYVVTDSPEKLKQAVGQQEYQSLAAEIGRRFNEADAEIIIITPYYVPQKSGVEVVEALLAKGLRVVIITNSLASTNHVPVHSGYSRYRKRLLKSGAELYELKVDAVNSKAAGETEADSQTLHTKAIVIDRETLFVGSLNFDPRSLDINTEMGVFIDSAEVARVFAEVVAADLGESTYSVQLNENNKLRWIYQGEDGREELNKEPQTSFWRRFSAGFYGVLPIEGQL